jgi:hypothetical protein
MTMFDTINSLAAVTMLGLAAYALGRWLARGLRLDQDDRLAHATWSLGLGMVAAGLALTMLGLAACLYREVIGVLTFCGGFWGLAEIIRDSLRHREASRAGGRAGIPSATEPAAPRRWLRDFVGALVAIALVGSLVSALAPPTAGDALCYHLELPKIFLARHALIDVPYSDNGTFPLLVEMWYLWGLALEGGVTAQLIHWGLGVLLALAAVVLATPILGRPWAWAVGAVVLLSPGVTNQMTAPLNDVGLAALTTLALAAWRRAAIDESPTRWYIAAGLFLGGALGSKYLALVFVAAVGLVWLARFARRGADRRAMLGGAATCAVIALSVSGVWFVRAAWYRGNPVYPFFERQVGGDAGPMGQSDKTPLGWHPLEIASAPWRITMHPDHFGGRGHQWGPLFLIALPGLLLTRRLRGLGSLLAVAGAYVLMWYALRQNLRFLLPVLPLAAVAVVWVWIELRRLPLLAGGLAGAVFLGVLALGAAAPVRRAREHAAVALGIESRANYLARKEPTWRATQWANLELLPGDRLLSQEQRAFYFTGDVVRESIYRRRTAYDRAIERPEELSRTLRAAGFTHLLLAEAAEGGITFDPTLSRLVQRQEQAENSLPPEDRKLRLVTEYEFADADGTRRYRLIDLR